MIGRDLQHIRVVYKDLKNINPLVRDVTLCHESSMYLMRSSFCVPEDDDDTAG